MSDSRKYLPLPRFNGVMKDLHPRLIPDDKVSDVLNVMFEYGKAKRRYGYSAIGINMPLDGTIMDIAYYEQLRTGDNFTVVFTTTGVYVYDSSTGLFNEITEYYNTGIVSCDTTALTGTGTTWSTGWSGAVEKIKFGTNDPGVTRVQFTGDVGISHSVANPEANLYWSVVYGNGLFVAVSANGTNRVMTSPDGETWTPHSAAEANAWYKVAFGNGVFIAMSNNGTHRIMRSTDGTSWSSVSDTTAYTFPNGLTYCTGDIFVANNGDTYPIIYTTDLGVTWNHSTSYDGTTSPPSAWYGLAYGDGVLIATTNGKSTTFNREIMRSTDYGVSWTHVSNEVVSNNWRYPAFGDGVFIIISSDYTWQCLRSTDLGVTWTQIQTPVTTTGLSIVFSYATYMDGIFWALGYDSSYPYVDYIMISSDLGLTWSFFETQEPSTWMRYISAAHGNNKIVLLNTEDVGYSHVFDMQAITNVSSMTNIYPGTDVSVFNSFLGVISSVDFINSKINISGIDFYNQERGSIFYADISEWRNITSVSGTTTAVMQADETTTGNTTNGSAVITNIPDTSTLHAGMGIDGTGIPAESYVLSIDSATQITISANATADGTGVTMTFGVCIEAAHDVDYVIKHCMSGDEDNLYSYCFPYSNTIDDKILVFTNGVDKIKKWDGSGAITDLTMSGITCDWAKCVGYFGASLSELTVIANQNDGSTNLPHNIIVSDPGDPESYSGASYDLLTTNDVITALKALGTRLVIYKTNSITIAWATPEGGATDPLDFEQNKATEVGCPAPRTIVDFGSHHIFLGLSMDSVNIYAFNGIQVEIIGSDISTDLKSNVALPYVHRSFAFPIRSKSLYCLFVPTGTSTFPDRVYVFNYLEKHWTIWEMADYMTAYGLYKNEYNPTWAEIHALTSVWPDMEMRWSDLKYYSQDAYPILGDSGGYVYDFREEHDDDNGTNIDAFFITRDYPLNDVKHTFKLLEAVVGYKGQEDGNDIQLRASVDFGNNYCNPITIEQNTSTDVADVTNSEYAETICNLYEKGRQARFKINNVDGSDFEVEGLIAGFTDEGGLTK